MNAAELKHVPRRRIVRTYLAFASLLFCMSTNLVAENTPADKGPSTVDATLRIDNIGDGAATELVGTDARLQLIVSRSDAGGLTTDWTRRVKFNTTPDGLVSIDSTGLVTPLADGIVTVQATADNGVTATSKLTVSGTGREQPVSFVGQVVPIFTKLGCNGGGCHGKISGQNGFRLSLLGFEAEEDHKRLIAESRARRVSLAAPDRSLLLMKTINAMPHGGGARTDRDSHEYRVMRRWIAQGMKFDQGEIRSVSSIRCFPEVRRMAAGSEQQLAVIATYSDGTVEDVTRAAVYESNDLQMAEVDETGLVRCGEMVGDVAVMARYQGHVSVFLAEVPLHSDRRSAPDMPNKLVSIQGDANTPQATNVVDRFVQKKLDSLGIPASPPCDDATFVRRITLDLTGRLPTLEETDTFLSNEASDKRARKIDELLTSDDYASFFARKWSVILRNRRAGGPLQTSNMLFHHWLKESLRTNKPYDQFVDELLTASGSLFSNPATAWLSQVTDQNERVEDISQLFLGQRIQCARCHHHPYEKWSQEDYARMSAFFSTIAKKTDGVDVTFVTRIATPSANHPKTGQSVAPAGLDSEPIQPDVAADPRRALSEWVTSPDNPFFAKALVNRYWKHFMGRGLVEPEDDLRVTNPPSNPELMDAMAAALVESKYDLKSLIRLICNSAAYSASSDAVADNLIDRRSHSRYYPKRLQAETLLDSIDSVTGATTTFAGMPTGTRAVELPDTGFDSYFLSVFGQPDSKTACECERSSDANLAQSLHLLNSEQMQMKLTHEQGRAAMLASDTSRPTEAKIAELYKLALSRKPTDTELQSTLSYLESPANQESPDSKEPHPRERWEDLIWALVNSKEFLFNH
ncbi:DUF1549 domain-containing protein [Neorhodopirellula pilleata]|uniref:Bacterial Ig-like domain (Group 2) n=1 Tax=Neorhodopirellula pilleata TaxID=2714738 RepID=A0A5C6ADK9_9BACT|nr:DUF1549 domain-containing protein [Neorhodopirellula pilleata]TWT96333.1 Bacterial Ig-like domain (group 2) [Neorhodopirellula pilleata]